MFTSFQQISFAQQDSQQVFSKIDSNKIITVDAVKNKVISIDKKIGKLPFKKSQLPELFLVVILLSCIAVLRYFFPKYLQEVFQQFLSFSADSRVLKNDKIGEFVPGIFYDILFMVLTTSFIYYSNKNLLLNTSINKNAFYILPSIIIVFLIFKLYLSKLIAWVFNQSIANNVVQSYTIINRHVTTIVLVVSISFLLLINPTQISKVGIYISIIIFSIIYLFHLVKMLVFFTKSTNVSIYNIFLYLCIIEFIPLVSVIVFIYRYLNN